MGAHKICPSIHSSSQRGSNRRDIVYAVDQMATENQMLAYFKNKCSNKYTHNYILRTRQYMKRPTWLFAICLHKNAHVG